MPFLKQTVRRLLRRSLRLVAPVVVQEVTRLNAKKEAKRKRSLYRKLRGCGVGVALHDDVVITDPAMVFLGNNVHIGTEAQLITEGGLTVGDNTHIADRVTIATVSHRIKGTALPYDDVPLHQPVLIGKNVWIDRMAKIAPGSRIGDGAVIGLGALVEGEVPAGAIVGGHPAQSRGQRDTAHYAQLEQRGAYGGQEGQLLSEAVVASYGSTIEQVQPVFIVSTGRSGSTTIARVLSQHPSVTCYHERRFQLVRLSAEYAHGDKTDAEVKTELKALYGNSSPYPEGVYGESDHHLFNMVSLLAALVPHSKFVWLIRDGRKVAASTTGRQWYQPTWETEARPVRKGSGGLWDYYRIQGHRCGAVSAEEWAAMSVFAKNCWYWSYVNTRIQEQLEQLPRARWMQVRLEELGESVDGLFQFVGVEPVETRTQRANAADYAINKHEAWSADMKAAFATFCGKGMDQWYPGWNKEEATPGDTLTNAPAA